jgi:sugar phosphate isomerase/epimerase
MDTPIICTYFTHAGPVSPYDANTASPLPLEQRAKACADAGFTGIGFAHDDIVALLAGRSAHDLKQLLTEYGLVHIELEVLLDWFVDGERRQASDQKRATLLRAAEALGARHIKVAGDLTGKPWPMEHLIHEFQVLCRQAQDAGTQISIELFPSSNLADLQTGYALIEGANCANGGLLIDIWHMVRGHIPMSGIAALPASAINHVELDDGRLRPDSDYFSDTVNTRCEPCAGEFPTRAFMEAIAATGYQGSYGAEILSEDWRQLPVEEAAKRAFAGTHAALRMLP